MNRGMGFIEPNKELKNIYLSIRSTQFLTNVKIEKDSGSVISSRRYRGRKCWSRRRCSRRGRRACT
jgi:hypothetical protein